MANFSKDNGLDKRSLFALLQGGRIINGKFIATKQVKGWTKPTEEEVELFLTLE